MVEPGADPAEVYAYDNEETMAYISNYGVRTLMSMVLKDIVVNKPADPITYVPSCRLITRTVLATMLLRGTSNTCPPRGRAGT